MAGILLRLVFVGDNIGEKKYLQIVYSNGYFPKHYVPTLFQGNVVNVKVDGKHVELSLWYATDQEEYDRLRPDPYTNAHVILLCFDIDSPNSLDNWISAVMTICSDLPIILVGYKKDLRFDPKTIESLRKTSERPVTPEEGLHVSQRIGAYKYLECSAKTGEGVHEVFEHAARAALLTRKINKKKHHCLVL
ncbi:putative GTP-binding protein rhoA [Gigaspora rosea]|uniref:Putative GTP-binding protein rhoA n=1 Tax=Gigaspora rosea TaxID=44941 RepID=A0A397UJP6_9GLOM|nr:putative GTP-binding protein rhoA [Gigaspora rosea]